LPKRELLASRRLFYDMSKDAEHYAPASPEGDNAFATRAELTCWSCILAGRARLSLDILSRELDPDAYDTEEFVSLIRKMTSSHPRARVRILVQDPGAVVARGHRLIDLAQRLSSFVEIRKPGKQHEDCNEAMLIVDKTGYIHRLQADRFEGVANLHGPRRARFLAARFDEIWQCASADANFRRLLL
jgi:hypothetical protein